MFTNLLKFILGFALAIAVLCGTGLTVALYFVNRTAITPPKPMYANDNPSNQAKKPQAIPKSQPKTQNTPNPTTSPTSTPTPTPTESPKSLPPDAYEGTVTWSGGLSMRAEPEANSSSTGGVGANKKVIILEESADKKWQKIRIADTDTEGWVKSGNIQRSQ